MFRQYIGKFDEWNAGSDAAKTMLTNYLDWIKTTQKIGWVSEVIHIVELVATPG